MAAAELALTDPFALTAQSHYEQIHRTPQHGTVLVWERLAPGKRWHRIEPYHLAAAMLGPHAGKEDIYLSVNEFRGWRLIRNLKSLRACYVDLDGFLDWELALEALQEAKMPAPSIMVHSGRGLHFYWLLEPLPSQALPVWQRVEDALVHALAPLGADYRAKDCTRLLRLVGSRNSKNGQEVVGRILNNNVWRIHELADEVLGTRPPVSARVLDFRAHVARNRKTRQRKHRAPAKGSIYAWWHLVFRDLCAIADYHWFGGIPEGHRDSFLFLMATSLSWFTCPVSLHSEINKTAHAIIPSFTHREIETYIKPVLKRAQDAAAGIKYEWQGREVDPRYRFRSETIREWLGRDELIVPDIWPELRALAPAHVIHARRVERDRGRDRQAEGRYSDKNTGQGYRSGQEENRASARLMRAQGQSIRTISAALGVSIRTIQRWCGDL